MLVALSSFIAVSLVMTGTPSRSHVARARAPLAFEGGDVDEKDMQTYKAAAPATIYSKTPGGLSYKDLNAGEGDEVPTDAIVSISYTATLLSTGKIMEQTSPNRAYTFKRGEARSDIFDESIEGMKVGATRRVLVNPSSKWALLSDDTIDFEIELLEVKTGRSAAVYQAGGVVRQLVNTAFFFLIAQDVIDLVLAVSAPAGDAAAAAPHVDAANAWAAAGLQSAGLM